MAYVCRQCETNIATEDNYVSKFVCDDPFYPPSYPRYGMEPLKRILFRNLNNLPEGVMVENRNDYRGRALACPTCHIHLGYKVDQVLIRSSLFADGHFDLRAEGLLMRHGNILVNAFIGHPPAYHSGIIMRRFYRPDHSHFSCRNCQGHLTKLEQFLRRHDVAHYGVFHREPIENTLQEVTRFQNGIPNTHVGVPFLVGNEQRSPTYCSNCFVELGYRIDRNQQPGEFIIDLRTLRLWRFDKVQNPDIEL